MGRPLSADAEASPSTPRGSAAGSLHDRVMSLRMPRDVQASVGVGRRRWLAAALALAAIAVWVGSVYREPLSSLLQRVTTTDTAGPSASSSTTASTGPTTSARPATSTVAAAPVPASASTAGKIVLESKGYVIPAHQILVSPKVTGMVVRLDLEEGRRVAKGDVLAELESVEYQRDFDRAKAALDLAKAQLAELENGSRPEEISQAEAELAQAREEIVDLDRVYKRQRALFETKATTEQELQRAESQYLATQRRIDRLSFAVDLLRKGPRDERIAAARATVAQAAADHGKAEWRLSNCKITAPISGTILKKNAEEGNVVNPMAFNGSFSLCELADLADLEIDLSIQERDVSRIYVGQRCRIRTEAYADRDYDGHVSRLMPIADRAKGAVPVRVKVHINPAEEGRYLKPEMGAIVSFFDTPAPAESPKSPP